MKSKYIKACLSAYFRFKYRCDLMATEVGKYNADFLVYRKGEMIECEIKISRGDINAEFSKKKKHLIYKTGRHYWIPNYFYFAVPEELAEFAVSKSISHGYGVMVISEYGKFSDRVRIIKRAKRLHTRSINEKVLGDIKQRLMSEMANLRINEVMNESNTI